MAYFVVYDTVDGTIIRTGLCPDSMVANQARPGFSEAAIAGEGSWATHRVINGEITALSAEVAAARAAKPRYDDVWDWGTNSWIDQRTLAQQKLAQWVAVKASRDAADFGGFTWDGSTFDSDPMSQQRIQGAAQLAQLAAAMSQPFEIDWTLADNSVRTLDGTDMIGVGMALGVHVSYTHGKGRVLRDLITAATTAEEVAAVVWHPFGVVNATETGADAFAAEGSVS